MLQPRNGRLLAEHLARHERLDKAIDAGAIAALERHAWPGNIRELRNRLIQAALRLLGSVITAHALELPEALSELKPRIEDRTHILRNAEMQAIQDFLARNAGNLGAAAAELKMHRVTLYRKLKRFGMG